ncbi:tetratricopeptide repeat protein [Jonesiaceae bacterium BS-20]|uniref:Tetratricopeptide repeat protein n=1 Tax=Jonesiaceae bacterium BS-20 TaxID=3120821 RepID=A0AAU7DZV5_9MICO
MRLKSLAGPVAVTVLLGIFVWAIGVRVVAMFQTGEPIAIALATGVAITMVIGVSILGKEWQLAATVQKMANVLAQRGELRQDELPRSPGGRIDRAAADAEFVGLRQVVEDHPGSWQAWFQLGFGYDAAGDRKRARQALRQAAKLFRATSR